MKKIIQLLILFFSLSITAQNLDKHWSKVYEAFEPVDMLSQYKWQDGLGYYMSTKDAATHFFFDNISKGKYILEYDVRVNNQGEFSNGITTIQSMYAPEFSSHSKGTRVKVKE